MNPAQEATRDDSVAPKRVFIIGCPRSGTTWMTLLLAQHPDIQACQQIGAVSSLHKFWVLWDRGEQHTRYHFSAIQFGGGERGDAEKPTYEPLLSRDAMLGISRSMLDEVYGVAAAKRPGCRVIVDSTPENALTPALMAELMPDAYFLHVIRDPRSVFASHRNGTKDFGAHFPTDPAGSANFWSKHITRARELRALSPNYREVRYETMKHDGSAELRALVEWMGLPADPAWCDAVIAKTSVEKLQGTKGTPSSFFRSGKAAGWREELTSRQLHAVEYYAGSLMRELGYEPVHPHAGRQPAGMVLREAMQRLVTSARRAAR